MSINAALRAQVRRRADAACEYCGVTEADTGAELTIDHYQPQTRGGLDTADNLIYACPRCNQYKSDYWPQRSTDLALWNPRTEASLRHFVELADGTLHPLTPIGVFTLTRLRLNRPPLITHRLNKRSAAQEKLLLTQYRDMLVLLEQLSRQQGALMEENSALLAEQRVLLHLLLEQKE